MDSEAFHIRYIPLTWIRTVGYISYFFINRMSFQKQILHNEGLILIEVLGLI